MPPVRFIHWRPEEAEERAPLLAAAGYEVDSTPFDGPPALKALRDSPPLAVVIDLSRAPSFGRDVALWLRQSKSTRNVPIVFVVGEAEKVNKIRSLLPDATFTEWPDAAKALARAIANPPREPVRPGSVMAAYAGTPLPKKLGIKVGTVVVLASAPKGFEKTLGTLPDSAKLRRQLRGEYELILWFVRSRRELEKRIVKIAAATPAGGTWILWPKQASGVESDLTQTVVRNTGLANGLVDYKVAAIDKTWSGLRFARRK